MHRRTHSIACSLPRHENTGFFHLVRQIATSMPTKATKHTTHKHTPYLADVLEDLLVPLAVPEGPVHPDVLHLTHRHLVWWRHRMSRRTEDDNDQARKRRTHTRKRMETWPNTDSREANGSKNESGREMLRARASEREKERRIYAPAHKSTTTAAQPHIPIYDKMTTLLLRGVCAGQTQAATTTIAAVRRF